MKYLTPFLILVAGLLITSAPAYGQTGPPAGNPEHEDRRGDRRPNLLAELGLSPEQVQEIRRMNQERRPAMMEAQRRMRDANRNLDIAIYGEAISDADFQTRLKELQTVRAELDRLRFEGELAVRKILTPEQLVRFREIRRRFAEARQDNSQDRRRQHRRSGPGRTRDMPPKRPIN
jgi:Spy/CpxP family protein refolding chaperone